MFAKSSFSDRLCYADGGMKLKLPVCLEKLSTDLRFEIMVLRAASTGPWYLLVAKSILVQINTQSHGKPITFNDR